MKYALGAVALALTALVGYYAWIAFQKDSASDPQDPPPAVSTSSYATSTFSIEYPSDFVLKDSYVYEGVPGKPVSGVKFSVPPVMTRGTNLSLDSGVSVEWLPRARNCTGDIYVLQNVRAFDLLVGSTTYSVATTTERASGNVYEELVYALPESSPCTAVRYFIHSSNPALYFPEEGEPAEIQAFDRAALLRIFDAIRDSLRLVPTSP